MFELVFSENAQSKLKELINKNASVESTYLRVYVSGGGCSGLSYGLALDDKLHDGDEVVQNDGIKVVVDPNSAKYLTGSSLDYVESVAGSGFVLSNPNNWSTCGCGKSFTPKDEKAPEGHAHAH